MIYRLSSYHQGLGDCLQFSTLPKMLTEAGHEVYLLDDPQQEQVKPFRNPEIKEFVWGHNPYIKGSLGGEWNAGDVPDWVTIGGLNIKTNKHSYSNTTGDFIKNWEKLHGLTPKNSFPKIYYKPKIVPNIEGVVELSSISLKYNTQLVKTLVRQIISQFPGLHFKQIVSENQHGRITVPNIGTSNVYAEEYKVNGLFDLFDVIGSCKVFISLNSGSHSMAAAAREYNKTMLVYCILPESDWGWIMEQKKFVYPSFTYLKESDNF